MIRFIGGFPSMSDSQQSDTVGELGSIENRALRMASCKAHDHMEMPVQKGSTQGK